VDDIVGRLQSCFSPHQTDVILGSLLGDARLECRSIGKRHAITARVRIHHSEKQRDYVFWKYEILKPLVLEGPRRIKVWHDPKRDRDHYSWYFHTRSFEILGLLHAYFYRSAVKILPPDILEVLTPRALAVWFMDDGSNTQESFTLNTHCFSKDAQERIIQFLKGRYNIEAKVVKDRTKYKIAIGRFGYQAFTRIVEPHIIPSMTYKIVNPRNDLIRGSGSELESATLSLSS
jgi:recombination protein RecA